MAIGLLIAVREKLSAKSRRRKFFWMSLQCRRRLNRTTRRSNDFITKNFFCQTATDVDICSRTLPSSSTDVSAVGMLWKSSRRIRRWGDGVEPRVGEHSRRRIFSEAGHNINYCDISFNDRIESRPSACTVCCRLPVRLSSYLRGTMFDAVSGVWRRIAGRC